MGRKNIELLNNEKIIDLIDKYFKSDNLDINKEFIFFQKRNEIEIEFYRNKFNIKMMNEQNKINENYKNEFIETKISVFKTNIEDFNNFVKSKKITLFNKNTLDDITYNKIIFNILNFQDRYYGKIDWLLNHLSKNKLIKKFIKILKIEPQEYIDEILLPKDIDEKNFFERIDYIIDCIKKYDLNKNVKKKSLDNTKENNNDESKLINNEEVTSRFNNKSIRFIKKCICI